MTEYKFVKERIRIDEKIEIPDDAICVERIPVAMKPKEMFVSYFAPVDGEDR